MSSGVTCWTRIVYRGVSCCVVQINSETDFVARNDVFQDLVRRVSARALDVLPSSIKVVTDVGPLASASVTLADGSSYKGTFTNGIRGGLSEFWFPNGDYMRVSVSVCACACVCMCLC